MSSINQIVQDALQRASRGRTSGEKVASASDIIKQASDVASALEYVATTVVDDGTATGTAQRRLVDDFFKDAAKGGPAESEAPTGTQADAPAAGARKILQFGLAKGDSPAESEAPTGTQATIGQPPGEKKAGRLTLLETLTGKVAGAASPVQSEALQDTAQPTTANENSNVARILDSNEGPVNATKRDAKMPTRARLKALFASASDTGPSDAAAKAAFPNAYAKGGMKVAETERDRIDHRELAAKEHARRISGSSAEDTGMHAGRGAVRGAYAGSIGGGASGAALGGLLGGAAGAVDGLTSGGSIKQRLGRGALHGLAGAGAGAATGSAIGAPVGALAGGISGGVTGHRGGQVAARGAERAHREHQRLDAKEASIADYAALFDKAAAGELGEEAKAFAEYIEQVQV